MAVFNGKRYRPWVQRRQRIPGSAISNWQLAVSQTENQPQPHPNPTSLHPFVSFVVKSGGRYE